MTQLCKLCRIEKYLWQSNRHAFKYYISRVIVYCIVCDVKIIFLHFFQTFLFLHRLHIYNVYGELPDNVIHRDDVESSNPYRLVSVQSIVSLRRLPIREFSSPHVLCRYSLSQLWSVEMSFIQVEIIFFRFSTFSYLLLL
jgi:hypothetical protein